MEKVKNPAYRVLVPKHQGADPWLSSGKVEIKEKVASDPFRVAPEDKRIRTHERASTCESLVAVYPDAITIGGPLGSGEDRGGAFMGLFLIAFMSYLIYFIFENFMDPWYMGTPFLFSCMFLFFGGIRIIKSGCMMPKDQPVIFDRKNRVVIFSRLKIHGHWDVLEIPKFVAPVVVPWDSIGVRSFKITQFTGKTLRDNYRLEIWAPESNNERPKLVAGPIGYLGWYEDEKLWQLYEHIRRYMEEDGPPIQHGEALRVKRMGRDLQPFPDEILASLGGPPLTDDEVKALAKTVPAQVFED